MATGLFSVHAFAMFVFTNAFTVTTTETDVGSGDIDLLIDGNALENSSLQPETGTSTSNDVTLMSTTKSTTTLQMSFTSFSTLSDVSSHATPSKQTENATNFTAMTKETLTPTEDSLDTISSSTSYSLSTTSVDDVSTTELNVSTKGLSPSTEQLNEKTTGIPDHNTISMSDMSTEVGAKISSTSIGDISSEVMTEISSSRIDISSEVVTGLSSTPISDISTEVRTTIPSTSFSKISSEVGTKISSTSVTNISTEISTSISSTHISHTTAGNLTKISSISSEEMSSEVGTTILLNSTKFTTTVEIKPSTLVSVNTTLLTTTYTSDVQPAQEKDDEALLHLAYILPSAIIIVLATLLSIYCLCRHKRRRKKIPNQESGYVLRRERNFSNPAFMEQNVNALACQLNSRDSMLPAALRMKLKNHSNSFDGIDLREEDVDIIKKYSNQNKEISNENFTFTKKKEFASEINNQVNISDDVRSKSRETIDDEKTPPLPWKVNKTQERLNEENTLPIPGKGRNVSGDSLDDESASHYDILPYRQSIPIKQRKTISVENEDKQYEIDRTIHNPQYDVIPLRTFLIKKHKSQEHIQFDKRLSNNSATENSVDTKNHSRASSSETFSIEQSENNDVFEGPLSGKDEIVNENDGHGASNRAPSFVVLPRAPSGSMRTAL